MAKVDTEKSAIPLKQGGDPRDGESTPQVQTVPTIKQHQVPEVLQDASTGDGDAGTANPGSGPFAASGDEAGDA